MQGSLQNAWFWKDRKWRQDVPQHDKIVIDFRSKNMQNSEKIDKKQYGQIKLPKKRFFWRKFLQKTCFGMDFDLLWDSNVNQDGLKNIKKATSDPGKRALEAIW